MISSLDVHRVYREDKRHPYYSLQNGHNCYGDRSNSVRPMERQVLAFISDRKWVWGHFRNAMERALTA